MKGKTVNKKILQIFTSVAQNLQKQNLIKSQEKILVTFSGGQDSICLLIIFFILRTQLLINFDLLYCHHFWQKSSFFTLLHVAKCNFCCSTNSMFFFSLKASTSEKSARDWRHKVIQRAIIFYGYKIVTQAHTKSDRSETILFNLIRGTGLRGAATLQFQSIQSLYAYNKFYPSTLLITNFLESFQYASIKTVKDADLLFFNTFCIPSQNKQIRQVRLQKVLGLGIYSVKKNNNKKAVKLYEVSADKKAFLITHQSDSLLEIASLPSEAGERAMPHSIHFYSASRSASKLGSKQNFPTFRYKARKVKLIRVCKRKSDVKTNSKAVIFSCIKQVCSSQAVTSNFFYFNLKSNVKAKTKLLTKIKVNSRQQSCFRFANKTTTLESKAKTKTYNFCYTQLKQLID